MDWRTKGVKDCVDGKRKRRHSEERAAQIYVCEFVPTTGDGGRFSRVQAFRAENPR